MRFSPFVLLYSLSIDYELVKKQLSDVGTLNSSLGQTDLYKVFRTLGEFYLAWIINGIIDNVDQLILLVTLKGLVL